MLFATATLAARIERAEAQTAIGFAEASRRLNADVLILKLGGTAAVYSGTNKPFNKPAGLGFARASAELDRADLAAT